LGRIEGVVSAQAGWKDRLEIVEVVYDPEIVDYEALVESAQSMECASVVFAHDAEQMVTAEEMAGDRARELGDAAVLISNDEGDQFYQLHRTPMIHLPLTLSQATKLNASPRDREAVLSPRQLVLLQRISAARLAGNAEALDAMVFPADSDELAAYEAELVARLNEIETP